MRWMSVLPGVRSVEKRDPTDPFMRKPGTKTDRTGHLRGLVLRSTVVAALFAAGAVQAQARVPLNEDRVLEDGLLVVAIGDYLRDNCEEIDARFWRSFNFARSLQARAYELGYSDDEIEAYLDDDAEKARVRAKARAYLEARGVVFGQPETFCTVGRAEISAETSVGRFLKVN